jgi:hypothetical protein
MLSMRFAGLDCGCVYAGDEVDYSAPYITLENGELVTRYPAKEHAPIEPTSVLVIGLLAAIVVFVIVARNRRRPQATETDDL